MDWNCLWRDFGSWKWDLDLQALSKLCSSSYLYIWTVFSMSFLYSRKEMEVLLLVLSHYFKTVCSYFTELCSCVFSLYIWSISAFWISELTLEFCWCSTLFLFLHLYELYFSFRVVFFQSIFSQCSEQLFYFNLSFHSKYLIVKILEI